MKADFPLISVLFCADFTPLKLAAVVSGELST